MLDVRNRQPTTRGLLFPLLAVLAIACGGPDLDGDGDRDDVDCDPKNAAVFSGAKEICNGADDDCDGFTDEDVSIVAYLDRDADGAGDPDFVSRVCVMPSNGSEIGGDCDDLDPAVAPGLPELCDGIDQDCDAEIDEDAGRTWFADGDGDGHGAGAGAAGGCTPGPGESFLGDDCDDAAADVFPGAPELCDDVDNDCDDTVDDGASSVRIWEDRDGDGYGDPALPAVGCATDAGFAPNDLDCDDTNPLLSPDAEDVQGDGEDQDCDGYVDEFGVPVPFATISDALQAAPDGAVVQLDAGTFVATVDLTGRDITFAGEGCDRTTLYADGEGTGVTMDRGRVEGLTIAAGTGTFDGTDSDGGGLWIGGDVTAERVCLERSSVSGQGGGAAVIAGTLTLRDSTVDRNFAADAGGGIYVAVGAGLVLEHTALTANTADGSGGGLAVEGGTVVATNSLFVGNFCGDDGGGAHVGTATDATVTPNQYLRASGTFDHCTFYANAIGIGEAPRGQAIFNRGSDLVVTSSGFAGHAGTAEVIEDHSIGTKLDLNLQDPLWIWSELGFFGNGAFDYDFMYLHDVLHAPPEFVQVDPALPPSAWDLRLLPGSAWIDAGDPAETDPDGTRSDIGAFGGSDASPDATDSYAGDADGDGLPDGWETHAGLDPLVADAASDLDGDGLDAAAEYAFGSAPDAADTDLDGVEDGAEDALGTLPRDPSDHAPFPDAGRDRWGHAGETVTADGSGSWDPDLDALVFTWTMDPPAGSALVAVDDPTSPVAAFTPDVAGTWTLTLTVDDGGATRADTVVVEILDGFVVPDDFPTIQAAIDASGDGDGISVRPGVYTENLAFGAKDITLAGLGDAPGDVVVDGAGLDRVVTLATLYTGRLGNLTLRNGRATLGGGIYGAGADIILSEVTLEDNVATDNGGGIYVASIGSLTATGLRVTGNTATSGGAIFALDSDVTITDALFADNAAIAPGGEGGALYLDNNLGSTNIFFVFRNVVLQDNTGLLGSALYAPASLISRFELSQSAFVGHSGALSPLYVTDGTIQLLDDVWFADDDTSWLVGGGVNGEWVVLAGAKWDSPASYEPGILTWPTPIWDVDPDFGLYTENGAPDDVFALRPGSPLVDAGLLLFTDPDGSPADIGPAGGPFAPRELRRWTRDDDADGMSDGWEVRFGLDPLANDANGDPDGDGRSNAQEYAASTDPSTP